MMSQDNVGYPKSARPPTPNQTYQVRPPLQQAPNTFHVYTPNFYAQPGGHPPSVHHAHNIHTISLQPARPPYHPQRMEVMQPPMMQPVPGQIQVSRMDPNVPMNLRNAQSQQQYADSSNQYMAMPYVYYPHGINTGGSHAAYQASPQMSQQPITMTAPNVMQSQAPSSTGSQYVQPSSQDKPKVRRPIKITDPKRGGKDITDEILNKKKEGSQAATTADPSLGEKVKQEFKLKISSAISAAETKQYDKTSQEKSIKESEAPYNEECKASDVSTNKHSVDQSNEASDANVVEQITGNEVESTKSDNASECSNSVGVLDPSTNQPIEHDVGPPSDISKEQLELNHNDVIQDKDMAKSDGTYPTDDIEVIECLPESTTVSNEQVTSEDTHVQEAESNDLVSAEEANKTTDQQEMDVTDQPGNETERSGDADENELNQTEVSKELASENVDDVENDVSVQNDVNASPAMNEDDETEVSGDNKHGNDDSKPTSSLSLVNGGEVSSSVNTVNQGPRKGKLKQRLKGMSSKGAKDDNMMSAFTDNDEKETEIVEETNEENREVNEDQTSTEQIENEETWENKEINVDEVAKTDERICYEREFLLKFKDSKEKPKDLPDLDLVLSEPHPPTKPLDKTHRMQSSGYNDFMPNYMRQGSGGRQAGMGRSGKGGRASVPKKIIPATFETKIELKKSENAWVRPSEKPQDGNENPEEELYRKARGILNKLTPQNFNKLLDQMRDLKIDTEGKLRRVIDLVFEKAISEPAFSVAYAKFCFELSDKISKVGSEKGRSQQALKFGNEKGQPITFKRLLLNKCQDEFEKEKKDELQLEKEREKHFENVDEEKRWQEELEERKSSTKRRSLGNIRFIGELFKLKMLKDNTMHICVRKLLKDRDEESLECLCKLLTTIGKDLDIEKEKVKTDQYIEQIDKIIAERKVASRVVFMLQDIKELRDSNWVSRRITDAPKTIDEIHEEAKQEQIQMQMAHQQAAQKRNMIKSSSGRGSPASVRGSQMPSDEGWNQVPVTNKSNRSAQQVDPAKLKLSKRTDSENISLGPGGRPGAWAQGASGGSSRFGGGSADEPRQGNRFSALSGQGSRGQQTGRFNRPNSGMSGRRNLQQLADEKAAALENVRRITKEGSRTPSPSNSAAKPIDQQKQSNAPSEVIDVPADREPKTSPTTEISVDKVKKETKMTVDEFMMTNDFKEAENCIRELNAACHHHIIVSEIINIAIEQKLEKGQAIGKLLHAFVKSELITLECFKKGLSEIIEFAEDIAVDIPHIWTNLGGVLGPTVNGGDISLSDLKILIEPLIQCDKAGLLMAEVLAAASKLSNEDEITLLWQKSGLKWEKLLCDGSDLDKFIKNNKMEFTMRQRDDKKLKEEIIRMLHNSYSSEQVIEWIESQVPPIDTTCSSFLRELSTAVYTFGVKEGADGYKFESESIKTNKNLLLKYLDKRRDREMEALFAAQLLADDLAHPLEFLRTIFDALYDEEIINEESVTAWESSDKELQGKGMALNSVQEFLKWLQNPEEEHAE